MPKNEVKCHKHDGFSITILEVSPTSSSWLSALSPLAVSLAPSVCCVLVSCSTCPALSVSSACPSSWPALRSLSSQDSEGWNRKNYMLIFHISNEVTVRMCKWGWVVRNFFIAKKWSKMSKTRQIFNHDSGNFPYLLLLVLCCVPAGCIFDSISLLCRACVVFYTIWRLHLASSSDKSLSADGELLGPVMPETLSFFGYCRPRVQIILGRWRAVSLVSCRESLK